MKAVILAGGLGTRIYEETSLKPKPMIEIDGKPILWHIMKIDSAYVINDFIICCGYRTAISKGDTPLTTRTFFHSWLLLLAEHLFSDDGADFAQTWNLCPEDEAMKSVGEDANKICSSVNMPINLTKQSQPRHESQITKYLNPQHSGVSEGKMQTGW